MLKGNLFSCSLAKKTFLIQFCSNEFNAARSSGAKYKRL